MPKCVDCTNLESETDDRLPLSWRCVAVKHIKTLWDSEGLYCKAKKKSIHKDFDIYKERECSDFVER